jgi:hypothetical protein
MPGSSMERSRDWRKYNESLVNVKRGELYLYTLFFEELGQRPGADKSKKTGQKI